MKILFSANEIAARVSALADEIAQSALKPDMAAPILSGAFVFAADLLRALNDRGLVLPMEFLWLQSYGAAREAGAVKVLVGPSEKVRGRTVLLIDGVLDSGATMARAKELLLEEGAAAVLTVVAVDKGISRVNADYACFRGVEDFIVGYGMDDGDALRGLPYIGAL